MHVVPRDPNRTCEHRTCDLVVSIDVYEVTANGVKKTTLLDGSDGSIDNAQIVWGEPSNMVVLTVDRNDRTRQLLRWRPGDAKPTLRPLTGGHSFSEELFATATGEVFQLDPGPGHGAADSPALPRRRREDVRRPASQERDRCDRHVYDAGVRGDGRLYVHWGNQLLLFAKDLNQPPRALDLEPFLERKTTWAGATVYLEMPESLWLGLGIRGGRDFTRVDLARAEKLANPWPWTSAAKPNARAIKGAP